MAGPRRHGPRADGHRRRSASPGTRCRGHGTRATAGARSGELHVVAIDYGVKRNILRLLASTGCKVTVVPAHDLGRRHRRAQARRRLPLQRPGRSGGDRRICRAGDPRRSSTTDIADLRHLPRPPDARHRGRRQDHEDAPGPSRREPSGEGPRHRQGRDHLDEPRLRGRPRRRCRRTSTETHVSLFDGSNCGIALKDKPVFSVQYHPEASPGPRDSHYLFTRFVELMRERRR